jgi:hypothetical protein
MRHQQYYFIERMLRALQSEPGFGQSQYRSHQICFLQNIAQREGNEKLSIIQISTAFGSQSIRVKAPLDDRLEAPTVRDRHIAVDQNSEAEILEWIDAQPEKCNPVIRTGLQYYYEIKYSILTSQQWVDWIILSHRDD